MLNFKIKKIYVSPYYLKRLKKMRLKSKMKSKPNNWILVEKRKLKATYTFEPIHKLKALHKRILKNI